MARPMRARVFTARLTIAAIQKLTDKATARALDIAGQCIEVRRARLGRSGGLRLVGRVHAAISGGTNAAGHAVMENFGMRKHQADRVLLVDRNEIGPAFRQVVEPVVLPRLHRPQCEMPAHQVLNAGRGCQAWTIARAARRCASCSRLISMRSLATRWACRVEFEFDLVDVGGRQHERGNDGDVNKTHHCARPITLESEGRRGSRPAISTARAAGASVRSAARSFAERARGIGRDLCLVGHDRTLDDDPECRRGGARLRQMA